MSERDARGAAAGMRLLARSMSEWGTDCYERADQVARARSWLATCRTSEWENTWERAGIRASVLSTGSGITALVEGVVILKC